MDEFKVTEEEYFLELIILLLFAALLVIIKIFACCSTLGLHQRHKPIGQRSDPISRAQFYNLKASNLSEEDSRETKPQEVSKSVQRSPEVSERTQQRNGSVQKSSRTVFTQTEKLELQPIVFSKSPQQISCSPDLPVEKYKPDPGLLTQIVQVHFSSVDQVV